MHCRAVDDFVLREQAVHKEITDSEPMLVEASPDEAVGSRFRRACKDFARQFGSEGRPRECPVDAALGPYPSRDAKAKFDQRLAH